MKNFKAIQGFKEVFHIIIKGGLSAEYLVADRRISPLNANNKKQSLYKLPECWVYINTFSQFLL
jgi:hypothetical protein